MTGADAAFGIVAALGSVAVMAATSPREAPEPPPRPRPTHFPVLGHVWIADEGGTRPLARLRVALVGEDGFREVAITDDRGEFVFLNRVSFGRYKVEILSADFAGSARVGADGWPPRKVHLVARDTNALDPSPGPEGAVPSE